MKDRQYSRDFNNLTSLLLVSRITGHKWRQKTQDPGCGGDRWVWRNDGMVINIVKPKIFGEKHNSVPLRPSPLSHEFAWDEIRASDMWIQCLTAWVMIQLWTSKNNKKVLNRLFWKEICEDLKAWKAILFMRENFKKHKKSRSRWDDKFWLINISLLLPYFVRYKEKNNVRIYSRALYWEWTQHFIINTTAVRL